MIRDVWVDTDAFVSLAESADPTDWREALDLYAGDLLPSVDAEWADRPRVILHERFVKLLSEVTAEREAGGDLAVALAWARRWSPPIPSTKARTKRSCACTLDWAATPPRSVTSTASSSAWRPISASGRSRRPVALPSGSGRSWRMPAGRLASSTPLIGRDDERTMLLTLLDRAASGQGALAVVLGEAGIGKSRLLQEVEVSADWRGWQIAYGRGEQFGSPAPFAPLGEALRAAAAPPRREQLRRVVEPRWLAVAAMLIPGLAPADGTWRAEASVAYLGRAVEEVLAGLGRFAPQLILLDDVQWADEATWALLDALRRALSRMPVLVVASGRADELREQPVAWDRLQAWDRAAVPFVHLRGLDADGLAFLSRDLDGRARGPRELAALVRASGGNPLLALALLQSGEVVETMQAVRGTWGPAGESRSSVRAPAGCAVR